MKLALIGKTLKHSLSPQIWQQMWGENNIVGSYDLLELSDLSNIRSVILQNSYDALNVTVPYKQEIIRYLDELSPEAEALGAVNAVVVDDNRLIGLNTDVVGFKHLFSNAIVSLSKPRQRTLICGYGGAARAVEYVLRELNHNVTIVSRSGVEGSISYDELNDVGLSSFDVIINTTPLGMYPEITSFLPLPYSTISSHTVAIDLVYNPECTAFMERCRDNGAMAFNGRLMLEGQAKALYNMLRGLLFSPRDNFITNLIKT